MYEIDDRLVPEHYRFALTQLGQKEIAGPKHNARVVWYFHRIGLSSINDDETAWCAAFLGACLEEVGVRSTRSAWARDYLKWGTPLAEPIPGCIVVYDRGNGYGHVNFFVKKQAGKILGLGGNQSNEVNFSWYDEGLVLGYRWPTGVPLPGEEPAPQPEPELEPARAPVDVEPEPTAPSPQWKTQTEIIKEGSRSMSWLKWLQIKLGIGAGGFGVWEFLQFFKGPKGSLHALNKAIVDNAPLLVGLFLVACLVSAIMAGIRLAEARNSARYDPHKPAKA